MATAYIIDPRDNVATLLDPCAGSSEIRLLGAAEGTVVATGDIRPEHKVALVDIARDASIVKYGMPIGHATCSICAGESVHLHNCASNYDERSNTLDEETGAPTDTPYV